MSKWPHLSFGNTLTETISTEFYVSAVTDWLMFATLIFINNNIPEWDLVLFWNGPFMQRCFSIRINSHYMDNEHSCGARDEDFLLQRAVWRTFLQKPQTNFPVLLRTVYSSHHSPLVFSLWFMSHTQTQASHIWFASSHLMPQLPSEFW